MFYIVLLSLVCACVLLWSFLFFFLVRDPFILAHAIGALLYLCIHWSVQHKKKGSNTDGCKHGSSSSGATDPGGGCNTRKQQLRVLVSHTEVSCLNHCLSMYTDPALASLDSKLSAIPLLPPPSRWTLPNQVFVSGTKWTRLLSSADAWFSWCSL